MRILFDGYWWVSGPTSNQNVLRGIVTTWSQEFPEDELALAVPARHADPRPADLPAAVRVVRTHLRPHALTAMLEMARVGRRISADHVLNQNFAALQGHSTVFLHDVIFQTNPEWFSRRERLYFSLMPLSIRRAAAIWTSTDSEAGRVRRTNPHAPRITKVGIAPHPGLMQSTPTPPPGLETLRDFYLCVGRFNPRKNLAVAVEAATRSGVLSRAHPLVIVGEGDHDTMPLSAAARDAVGQAHIVFVRFVRDEQLAWLYTHARLMVFVSLDEGFGLPPVEALAFGCPVLVSDIAVFHETMGDHATYVDPTDVDAVAAGFRALENTTADRQPYQRTSWSECVQRMRTALVASSG
jgi:glycosyltransferase involved in cell wall biosynthesis